jgi:hypothetical protein
MIDWEPEEKKIVLPRRIWKDGIFRAMGGRRDIYSDW